MALSTAIQTDMAFKDLKRKSYTNLAAKFFEENRSRNRYLPAQFVMGEDIPYPPPANDTDVIEWFDVPLVLDNGVPNRRAWFIHKPGTWQAGWDSSKDQANVGRGFVDPALGGPLYVAKMYRGTAHGGARVPEAHSSDWVVDYDAGVVTFNTETPPETGVSIAQSPRLILARYRGKSVLEVMTGASGKLLLRGDLQGIRDGVNDTFTLPTAIQPGDFYEIRCSRVPLDADDYTINGLMVTVSAAPMAYQPLDIVYYPA